MNVTKQVDLNTSHGTIRLELDEAKAPETVKNFITNVENGHFDNTVFHRVIKGFMVQGGGFEPGMSQKPTGSTIQNEASNGLKNDKYTVAMARTSDPHSATAQFFINASNNEFLNFKSETQQGWGYAVFGRVVSGNDVIDAIEEARAHLRFEALDRRRQRGLGDVGMPSRGGERPVLRDQREVAERLQHRSSS